MKEGKYMGNKFYYLFCLICITIITILVSGCSLNGTKSSSSNTVNYKSEDKLTMDEIKQSYAKTDEKILNTKEYKNYVLVESQAPTLANHFTLYDLKTGDKDILPSGIDFIDSANIINENHIILYAKGTNSESVGQIFPFEIDCMRGAENNNVDGDFIPTFKNIKFPINKQISLKGKGKEEITDIRVTVNGLQVCFGPQSGSDASFNADYVDIPTTDISYDKTVGELSLKLQDTLFAKSLSNTSSMLHNNTYIKSLSLKENENSAIITIKLNDSAQYYIGKKASIEVGIPYMDIQFFNSNM
jgi:PBP1b-binding outer membrane lipoprotein LpoB